MMKGDFLAVFAPGPVRAPDPAGPPAYTDAARILFADAGQMLGVARRLIGDRSGEQPGSEGRAAPDALPARTDGVADSSIVGDAVVVATQAESATMRVDRATDAIMFGDWAAPQRPSLDACPITISSTSPRP